jgi:hypothetical protein
MVDPQTAALQSQLGQANIALQIAEVQAKIRELNSRANLQDVKARNAAMEPDFRRMDIATKGIYQVQADQQDREFKRRMDLTNSLLKARDIASNERIAAVQSQASVASEAIKARAMAASKQPQPVPHPVPVPVPVRVPVPHPIPVPIPARGAQILG